MKTFLSVVLAMAGIAMASSALATDRAWNTALRDQCEQDA